MRRTRKIRIAIAFLIAIILGVFVYKFNDIYAVGSYPYSEYYNYNNAAGITLFNCLENYKSNNPQYVPPVQLELIDGSKDSADYWYQCYFFIPTSDLLLYVVINKSPGVSSHDIRLVAINKGITMRKWERINKELTYKESKKIMSIFENTILDRLPLKYNEKGNGLLFPFLH